MTKIFLISCSFFFLEKVAKWSVPPPPPEGWHPLLWEMLDPPLMEMPNKEGLGRSPIIHPFFPPKAEWKWKDWTGGGSSISPSLGRQQAILPIFPKKFMKLKEFGYLGCARLPKLCVVPDIVEFVTSRFSHFYIAIAYSNSTFCGAWTPAKRAHPWGMHPHASLRSLKGTPPPPWIHQSSKRWAYYVVLRQRKSWLFYNKISHITTFTKKRLLQVLFLLWRDLDLNHNVLAVISDGSTRSI